MSANSIRFGPYLKELRIHLCQTSPASHGVREFMHKHYVPLKKANPTMPILVRECSGISPRIWARYEYGRESSHGVENAASDDVLKLIEKLGGARSPQ